MANQYIDNKKLMDLVYAAQRDGSLYQMINHENWKEAGYKLTVVPNSMVLYPEYEVLAVVPFDPSMPLQVIIRLEGNQYRLISDEVINGIDLKTKNEAIALAYHRLAPEYDHPEK